MRQGPGLAVLVIKNDVVVHCKGYGLARLDLPRPEPISAVTNFRLASLTKAFTAMAIMILKERGGVRYCDPITRFLPQFAGSGPPERITVLDLLHHTSGLREFQPLFKKADRIDWNWPRSSTSAASGFEPRISDVVNLLATQHLCFDPGSEFDYCNSGYVLLAAIIEEVVRGPYGQFLKHEIFDRLGMISTTVSSGVSAGVENPAISYDGCIDGGPDDISYTPLDHVYGEDGVFSNLRDLQFWHQTWFRPGGPALVAPATLDEALQSGVLTDGRLTNYGFGWGVWSNDIRQWVTHTGEWEGYQNFIEHYFVPMSLTVIVLGNWLYLEAAKVGQDICEVYLSEAPALPAPPPP
jgi:CubicO group peptidase (beta-lactamase class C family)